MSRCLWFVGYLTPLLLVSCLHSSALVAMTGEETADPFEEVGDSTDAEISPGEPEPLEAYISPGGRVRAAVGEEVELRSVVHGGQAPYHYHWRSEDTGESGSEETISLTFSRPGTYRILLDVFDSSGQGWTDAMEVRVD